MRVLMNECRVLMTEKQFPRTHGQVSNTYLLPATAEQEDKERRHLEKEQGTNTQS